MWINSKIKCEFILEAWTWRLTWSIETYRILSNTLLWTRLSKLSLDSSRQVGSERSQTFPRCCPFSQTCGALKRSVLLLHGPPVKHCREFTRNTWIFFSGFTEEDWRGKEGHCCDFSRDRGPPTTRHGKTRDRRVRFNGTDCVHVMCLCLTVSISKNINYSNSLYVSWPKRKHTSFTQNHKCQTQGPGAKSGPLPEFIRPENSG